MQVQESPSKAIHRTRLPYWATYSRLDDREQADLGEPEVEHDGHLEPQSGTLLRPNTMWQDGYTTAASEHEAKLRVTLAALCMTLLATAGGCLVIYAVWRARIASAPGADEPQSTTAEAAKATTLPRVDGAGRLQSFDCSPATSAPVAPSVQLWCCLHRNVLCPAVTTASAEADGEAGSPMPSPSAEQLAEVPRFNCSVGVMSWALSWSLTKKDWCCVNKAVACPRDAPPPAPASVWETLSSSFLPQRPVVSTTLLPSLAPSEAPSNYSFNCLGFQWNGSDWSPSRREWCCERMSVGC